MLRPPPKLYLYSCGWSDAPSHIETISGGLVFDIGNVGRDYDLYVPRWLIFGGEGGIIDKQMSRSKALNDLLDLLQSFCARFFEWPEIQSLGAGYDCLSDLQPWQASLALAHCKIEGVAC